LGAVESSKRNSGTILGISFFAGNVSKAVESIRSGGLLTAPSGPGLATDLLVSKEYRKALSESTIVLADSGLLSLGNQVLSIHPSLKRISGLLFLQEFIKSVDFEKESCFWIMPDEIQSDKNRQWLQERTGAEISDDKIYIAPEYKGSGAIKDEKLLEKIEGSSPSYIILQIGGGVQERLGLFLKNELSYSPSIICTGAALAFLSGCQTPIPKWADSFYCGWFLRCLANPKVFIPRYWSALHLVFLLLKYREKSPVVE
jgi:UDP-N-acetyl-D-mannosaminuronic acid transferase (WecB/TagA/CpsF family)